MYKPKLLTLKNFASHPDTSFEFRQGSPILLVGRNLDDSSQKANGSGKSSLVEAISYLITGSTIRSIKDKELIMDGEDLAVISITLENSLTKETLYIERTLKEKSSSTCYIEINGVEEKKASINDYNSYILSKIGLSKEDFWGFFVVTKERYTPFLSSTDSLKKSIINRFSKADLIDQIDTKTELEKLENEKRIKEISISKLEGVIETLNSNEEFNLEECESKIKDLGEGSALLKTTQGELSKEFKETSERRAKLKDSLELVNKQKQELQTNLDSETNKINKEFTDSSEKVTSEVKRLKEEESSQILLEVNEYKSLLKLKQDELYINKTLQSEGEKIIKDISDQLLGEITCPKCDEKFLIKQGEFSLEELKAFLVEVQETQKVSEQAVESTQEDINLIQGELKRLGEVDLELITKYSKKNAEELEPLQKKLTDSTDKLIKEFRENSSSLKDQALKYEEEITQLNTQIEGLNLSMSNTKVQIGEIDSAVHLLEIKIKNHKEGEQGKLIKEKEDEKLTLEKGKLEVQAEVDKYLTWGVRLKRFKSYLSNLSLSSIETLTNQFLESLNSNLRIELDGYKELSDKKMKEEITCQVIRDGWKSSSYGRYSGGERGRVDVCSLLALQQLINLNSPSGGMDLLICDEILDSIDSLGIESLLISLKPLGRNIILVSQNEIQSLQSDTVTVVKQNSISKIQ